MKEYGQLRMDSEPVTQQPQGVNDIHTESIPEKLPSGLRQVAGASEVTVQQHIDSVEVVVCCCMRPNRYSVYAGGAEEQCLYIQEVSDCYARQITGAARGFTLKFGDNDMVDTIRLIRPQTCSRGCAGICCTLPTMKIQTPPGTTVANITERRSCLYPEYHVTNLEDQVMYSIQPTCCYSWLTSLIWDIHIPIKAVAVNNALEVIHEANVKFDTDLPEFGTSGGAIIHNDKVTVTSPTAMWVKALDMLLDKMKSAGFDFSKVTAISGDGQQHGSVYWKKGARKILTSLKPSETLYNQLKESFSVPDSPIWMDASTTKQCRQLEQAVGSPEELSRITGSRAFERYTGNQIMKIYQTNKDAYENTERISLVSSFAACLFLGDYAPIDFSDGSGMNLLDINTKQWSSKCLEACGPDLASRLGEPVPSHTVVGSVSSYLVEKYGFSKEAKVVAFTGDNPASLAGMAPREGDVIVSLGSSDTVFLWLPDATPGLYGHIFVNPLDPNTYMGLVCFKNGSLTRERIMEKCAEGSWDSFTKSVKQTAPGNNGNIGIYFDVTEIQPVVMGTFRFGEDDKKVESFPSDVEVRAVLEGQFMARLMYAQYCGLKIGPTSRVLATGGASVNESILQVIADIFNTAVFTTDVPNSASLGGCYRAKHAVLPAGTKFSDVVEGLPQPVCVAKHTPGIEKVYGPMLTRYKTLEGQVAAEFELK